MSTTAALNKRIERLEDKTSEEQHVVIFVEYEGTPTKKTSGYIMEKCEEACHDEERLQRLLEQAFMDVEGVNPFAAPEKIKIIPFYVNVAAHLVELLRKESVAVSL